jgi:hypothetical protein
MTKGDECVTNALKSDASPPVKDVSGSVDPDEPRRVATFLRAARSWREMAE